MKKWALKQAGFTIVELLIVIVVIAILAAVTIVGFTAVRERAVVSSVQSALSQANKKVMAYALMHGDVYPDTLAEAGVSDTASVAYQYSVDNASTPRRYAITASNGLAGPVAFYMSSTQSTPVEGTAPGHNLVVWDKAKNGTSPINISSGLAIDTAVFRTHTASVRITPGTNGKSLRGSPISGVAGQTVTISLWIRTDANWNGTSSNSKIRFGATSGGGLLYACSYSGVKTTWTQATCSYTLTPTNSAVTMTVGNDGTVGNIWLDDVSVSIQ